MARPDGLQGLDALKYGLDLVKMVIDAARAIMTLAGLLITAQTAVGLSIVNKIGAVHGVDMVLIFLSIGALALSAAISIYVTLNAVNKAASYDVDIHGPTYANPFFWMLGVFSTGLFFWSVSMIRLAASHL